MPAVVLKNTGAHLVGSPGPEAAFEIKMQQISEKEQNLRQPTTFSPRRCVSLLSQSGSSMQAN
jgi:hypothetical protein